MAFILDQPKKKKGFVLDTPPQNISQTEAPAKRGASPADDALVSRPSELPGFQDPQAARFAKGIPGATLNLATGTIGFTAGGINELGTALKSMVMGSKDPVGDARKAGEWLASKLTYQPRSPEGREMAGTVGTIMNAPFTAIDEAMKAVKIPDQYRNAVNEGIKTGLAAVGVAGMAHGVLSPSAEKPALRTVTEEAVAQPEKPGMRRAADIDMDRFKDVIRKQGLDPDSEQMRPILEQHAKDIQGRSTDIGTGFQSSVEYDRALPEIGKRAESGENVSFTEFDLPGTKSANAAMGRKEYDKHLNEKYDIIQSTVRKYIPDAQFFRKGGDEGQVVSTAPKELQEQAMDEAFRRLRDYDRKNDLVKFYGHDAGLYHATETLGSFKKWQDAVNRANLRIEEIKTERKTLLHEQQAEKVEVGTPERQAEGTVSSTSEAPEGERTLSETAAARKELDPWEIDGLLSYMWQRIEAGRPGERGPIDYEHPDPEKRGKPEWYSRSTYPDWFSGYSRNEILPLIENSLEGKPLTEVQQAKIDELIQSVRPEYERYVEELQEQPAMGAPETRSFTTSKGSTYQINEDGTTTRNKAARPEHPGDYGTKQKSEKTYYVSKEDAAKLGEVQAQGAHTRIAEMPDGKIGVQYIDGKDAGKFEKRTVVTPQSKPDVGLMPVEIWDNGKSHHFGNEIVKIAAQGEPAKETFALTEEEAKAQLESQPTQEGFNLGLKGESLRAPERGGGSAEPTELERAANEAADREKQAALSFEHRQPPEVSDGITLQGGIPGVDPFFKAATEFYKQDVSNLMKNTGKSIYELGTIIWKTLDPKAGTPRDVLDIIKKKIGDANYSEFIVGSAVKAAKKALGKLPREGQIAFIDRIKRGENQPTPELQQMADLFRTVDDSMHAELQAEKPDLNYLENHARIIWKKIPSLPKVGRQGGKGIFGIFRRPLKGSMGWSRRNKLTDMSEGLQRGGEPWSYNAFELLERSYADAMKFVTTKRMMKAFRDEGQAKYVLEGHPAPEGMKIPDDNAFRAFNEEGHRIGGWAIDENAARVINNFVSPDGLRQTTIGRGLLGIKNHFTGLELGLNLFHLTFESLEAGISKDALMLRKVINLGLRGDLAAFLEIPGDYLYRPAMQGGKFKRFAEGLAKARFEGHETEYLKNPWVMDYLEKVPDAQQYIRDLFDGGIKDFGMHQDYKVQAITSFNEAWANHNYFGALPRGVAALNQVLMLPLFEVYIPRIKVGVFLQEFPLRLRERAKQLASGTETRAQLARQTWESIEDRFGEMNFDNLFWNRTFKSTSQLILRSTTWLFGNIRAFGKAFTKQAEELVNATREKRVPQLDPHGAWLLGLIVRSAAIAEVIQYSFTGKHISSMKDVIAPQWDPNDESKRLSMATYLKEPVHFVHDPVGYFTNKFSGNIGKAIETLKNRDFYGVQVYDPHDPIAKKTWDMFTHNFPMPISFQSYKSLSTDEAPAAVKALSLAGFPKAPGYLTKTGTEQLIEKYIGEDIPQRTKTKEEGERYQKARDLLRGLRAGGDFENLEAAQEQGQLSLNDIHRILKSARQDTDEDKIRAKLTHLTFMQTLDVYNEARSSGDKKLLPVLADEVSKKFRHSRKSIPEDKREKYYDLVQSILDEADALESAQ